MGKSVQDVMTRDPRTATPSLSLMEAAQIMKTEDAGALPVVEDGRLVGIVTDRDIVVRAVAEGGDPRTLTIGDIASRPVIALTPRRDLDDALAVMAQHQVRRLPVGVGRRGGRYPRAGRCRSQRQGKARRRDARGDLQAGGCHRLAVSVS